MATTTFNAAWNGASTATAGAAIVALHNALISVGLIQTSDTGQLDLSTSPTYSSTVNTVYGYTVYRWPDTYQATYPLFMRIDWRNATTGGTNAPTIPQISIGTGTNGAGTLSGKTASFSVAGTTYAFSVDATLYPNYVCYSNGSLAIAVQPTYGGAGNGRQGYTIGRLHNLDGTVASGAWITRLYGIGSNNSGIQAQTKVISANRTGVVTFDHASAPSATNTPLALMPYPWFSESTSTTVSGDVNVVENFILDPNPYSVLAEVLVPSADVAFNTDFQVTRLGATHTYKSLAGRFYYQPYDTTWGNGTNRLGWAMLWE